MGRGTGEQTTDTSGAPRAARSGVHETHCCPLHGCKYGDQDCPVESGQASPRYDHNNGCEQCEADREKIQALRDVRDGQITHPDVDMSELESQDLIWWEPHLTVRGERALEQAERDAEAS